MDVDDVSRRVCGVPERVQLHVAMLVLQFGYAGFHVVSRAALNMGISKLVFLIYRNIVALIFLVPFAYFIEKKDRPTMSLSFLVQFFLLALIGITANQGFYLLGLDNTSPTFASAIQNSVPAITFLMAAILRIEKVRLNRRDGIGKLVGTLLCVAGASVITLYKGPIIFAPSASLNTSISVLPMENDFSISSGISSSGGGKNWTLGCLYLIGHCLSWSGWLVLQAPVLKKYPARLSITSYTCFFGLLQFLAVAAFAERSVGAWAVHSVGELFSVIYAGLVASGIAFAVQIWCIDRGGPVFVAVYQPVQTLVVAVMTSVTLGEQFYLGGVIGAVLIIAGLYLVLWGKSQERAFAIKEATSLSISSNSSYDRDGVIIPASTAPYKAAASLSQPLIPPHSEDV